MRDVTQTVLGVFLAVFLWGPAEAQEKEGTPPATDSPDTEKALKLAKLGRELAGEGKAAEAIEKYRKAVELAPRWTAIRFDLGRLVFLKGQRHYFDSLEATRRAEGAKEGGDEEQSERWGKVAQGERARADPLLTEAEQNLEIVADSRGRADLRMNAYVLLGHINAIHEKWQEAKDRYNRAKEILEEAGEAKPDHPGLVKIRQAIDLMDEEIEKRKARKEKAGEKKPETGRAGGEKTGKQDPGEE